MDRGTFEARLRTATCQAVEFARQLVREALPDEVVFLVFTNQSCDKPPPVGDEVVFPDDSLPDGLHPDGRHRGPWPIGQVVEFLWRDEKVPEWIDIMVQGENGYRTEVALVCCGRFTARDDLLYYPGRDTRPFAVKSPILPPGWGNVDGGGKFTLHWRKSSDRSA
jgi:hypothetical protein